jgi:hypothetical protein
MKEWWTEPRKHFAEHQHHGVFWISPIVLLKEGTSTKEREKKELQLMNQIKRDLNKREMFGG